MRIESLHRRIVMDARVLHEHLHHVYPVELPKIYQHQGMNLGSFLTRINAVTRPLNVVSAITNDGVARRQSISFSGEWLPECLLPANDETADIRIYWMTHPRGRRVHFTPSEWAHTRFVFWTVLMHELTHRHQDVYRGDTRAARVYRPHALAGARHDDQLYLGDYDEIEAHAHDIALEALHHYPGHTLSMALSKMAHPDTKPPSSTYPIYLETFAGSTQHPAVRVMHRKVRLWYATMQKNLDFYHTVELC